MDKAAAFLSYVTFGLVLLVWLPFMGIARVLTALDPTRRFVGRSFRVAAVVVTRLCPLWRMRVAGVEGVPLGPFVVVANHESILDIFLLSHVPWEMKWVAKASLFRVPFIGWMMRLAGDIPVHRGNADSGAKALEKARWYLDRGMSVMFFPEGTRSRDGSMGAFKAGAFRLAIESGCPVLPIAVHGSAQGMPVASPWIRRARPSARVLAPIDVAELNADDVEALRNRARALLVDAVKELASNSTGGALSGESPLAGSGQISA